MSEVATFGDAVSASIRSDISARSTSRLSQSIVSPEQDSALTSRRSGSGRLLLYLSLVMICGIFLTACGSAPVASVPASCIEALDIAEAMTTDTHRLAQEADFFRNTIKPLSVAAVEQDAAAIRKHARKIRIHDARVTEVSETYNAHVENFGAASENCRAE
jgi:hypothetical protein